VSLARRESIEASLFVSTFRVIILTCSSDTRRKSVAMRESDDCLFILRHARHWLSLRNEDNGGGYAAIMCRKMFPLTIIEIITASLESRISYAIHVIAHSPGSSDLSGLPELSIDLFVTDVPVKCDTAETVMTHIPLVLGHT